MAKPTYLADVWSATEFSDAELGRYAAPQIRKDTREGVQILATLSLSVNILALLLVAILDAVSFPVYSHIALAALSLHVLISARFVDEIRALQGLGMVLIIVTALAVILVAHRSGDLSIGMMAAIVMLFISIPLIPWALRETTVVVACTILLLTSSLFSVPGRFNLEAFWLLQLLVLGSLIIVALLVARNTAIRKRDIRARLDLDNARHEMELIAQKDHLTGAWNRRYLEKQFPKIAKECRDKDKTLHVAVLDIDDFKGINDQYGHQLADVVLTKLGQIFIRSLADAGTLVRLGGDEFLILYCGDDLEALIGRVVAELQDEPSIRGIADEREISLSAGFSSAAPNEIADPDKLYMLADKALYSMKNKRQPVRREIDMDDSLRRTGSWRL
ncbi:MAG: GGDEF domain-containing protein [Gammaproteobacteria bacterium]|nr:GGDEF domain-containing protein [Gammaproteobacteria bacterium]